MDDNLEECLEDTKHNGKIDHKTQRCGTPTPQPAERKWNAKSEFSSRIGNDPAVRAGGAGRRKCGERKRRRSVWILFKGISRVEPGLPCHTP